MEVGCRVWKLVKKLDVGGWKNCGFQKYLEDALAENNEVIVCLSHAKDLYPKYVEVRLCEELIETYNTIGKQLYRLSETWTTFSRK